MPSAADYAAGLKACIDNGVSMPTVLDACVLDYGLTKDPTVVRGYQGLPAPVAVNPSVDYRADFEDGVAPGGSRPSLGRFGRRPCWAPIDSPERSSANL